MEAAVDTVVKEFGGRLDVFVANSGTSWGDEAFIDADISRYHNLMKINADGVVYCARAAGKHFRRQKVEGTTTDGSKLTNYSSGSFIATASMSGRIVNIPRRQAAYNASKAHVIHLCKFCPLVILLLESFSLFIFLYAETYSPQVNPLRLNGLGSLASTAYLLDMYALAYQGQ